jgi:hypothetical protein
MENNNRFERDKLKIWVDIDETICNTPTSRKYSESEPKFQNIEKVNNLYDQGHEIIYWTARGCKSGKDYSELTLLQLKKWGCKFHRLETEYKKPNYDILIDDKAVNSLFDWETNNIVEKVYNAHEDESR